MKSFMDLEYNNKIILWPNKLVLAEFSSGSWWNEAKSEK